MAFLHGVEVIEVTDGPRPVRSASTGVIGLVGTATKGPMNEPTLIRGSRSAGAEVFGTDGTIPDALEAIFNQIGALVVCVNVYDPATHKTSVAAAAMNFVNGVVQLPHGEVSAVVVQDDAAGTTTYTAGTDYTLDAEAGTITEIAAGSINTANPVYVAYDYADPSKVTAANIAGGVDVATGAYSGVSALLGAESDVGMRPKILIAPGYSDEATVGNALVAVAERLRGVAVIEGPDTTDSAATTYRDSFSSRRAYVVDPGAQVTDTDGTTVVTRPNSGYAAGVIARNDNERGFWWSPSNRGINGIVGTTRPVDFVLGEEASRANVLNADEVATIIRQDGFRLWGNRTCSSDPKWAFLSVVRTADAINDALLRSHLWAVDRNITRTYLEDVAEGVNDYLRELKGLGAILGGSCVPSPELNTPTTIAAGQVYFDFDFTPPAPAERVTFRSRVTNEYVEEILA